MEFLEIVIWIIITIVMFLSFLNLKSSIEKPGFFFEGKNEIKAFYISVVSVFVSVVIIASYDYYVSGDIFFKPFLIIAVWTWGILHVMEKYKYTVKVE